MHNVWSEYTLNAVHTFHIQNRERKSIKYGFDTRVIWRARPECVYLSLINIIPRSGSSSCSNHSMKVSLPLERPSFWAFTNIFYGRFAIGHIHT